VIITDSLSTLMAVDGDINSKNPKTLSPRELLDEEPFWVPGHMGIPENEIADEEAKTALEDDLLSTEKYPPQDLIDWIKTEDKKTRKKDGKMAKKIGKKRLNEIKTDQVVISRLRTGYTMVTHGYIINKQDNNKCPYKLS
jgi:hypothetical protein